MTIPRNDQGPGVLKTNDVGCYTIATTTLLDARRIMAYAASVNDPNPVYFDDTRSGGLIGHPGLAFSLQWNSRFQIDRPLNARAAPYGVHATTDLRLHRPFRQGEAITTQGRLIFSKQIKPGVFSVNRYSMRASDGELVAELDYGGIVRGGTLEGSDKVIENEKPWPDHFKNSLNPEWIAPILIPPHAAQIYTECANIYNPIHTERSVALAAGLPDIILHGSATNALSLSEITNRCFDGDPSRIVRLCGQLRSMVLMNTTIQIRCLEQHETAENSREVYFDVLNNEGKPAIAHGVVVGKC